MREVEWRAWLESLPSDRSQLQDVRAELAREVAMIEARLTAAIWQRHKSDERAVRIELNELNSKLMLIHSQLKALDLPALPKPVNSVI